jgi:hypothetical protein
MVVDWAIWGPIAGSLVAGGASVTNSALIGQNYRVRVNLEIMNWTKWEFSEPILEVDGGVVSVPPTNILPLMKEIMVNKLFFSILNRIFYYYFSLKSARKTGDIATGSYGTVLWLVRPLNVRFVIMWSAPYSFDFH